MAGARRRHRHHRPPGRPPPGPRARRHRAAARRPAARPVARVPALGRRVAGDRRGADPIGRVLPGPRWLAEPLGGHAGRAARRGPAAARRVRAAPARVVAGQPARRARRRGRDGVGHDRGAAWPGWLPAPSPSCSTSPRGCCSGGSRRWPARAPRAARGHRRARRWRSRGAGVLLLVVAAAGRPGPGCGGSAARWSPAACLRDRGRRPMRRRRCAPPWLRAWCAGTAAATEVVVLGGGSWRSSLASGAALAALRSAGWAPSTCWSWSTTASRRSVVEAVGAPPPDRRGAGASTVGRRATARGRGRGARRRAPARGRRPPRARSPRGRTGSSSRPGRLDPAPGLGSTRVEPSMPWQVVLDVPCHELALGPAPLRHPPPGARDGHPQPHARLVLRPGQLLRLRRLPRQGRAAGAPRAPTSSTWRREGRARARGRRGGGARAGRSPPSRRCGPASTCRSRSTPGGPRCCARRSPPARWSATTSAASPTPTTSPWPRPPVPRWWPPTSASGPGCPIPSRSTTSRSSTPSAASSPTGPSGPRRPASPASGSWSTPASTSARPSRSRSSCSGPTTGWPRSAGRCSCRRRTSGSSGTSSGTEVDDRREASHAAHALGIALGCRVLRAHDVRGARRTADVMAAVLAARQDRASA